MLRLQARACILYLSSTTADPAHRDLQARTDSKRRGKRKPQRARMLPEGAATSEAEDTPKTPVSVPREEPATTTAKSQAHRTGTTPDTAQPGGTTVGLSKKGKNRKNKKQVGGFQQVSCLCDAAVSTPKCKTLQMCSTSAAQQYSSFKRCLQAESLIT